MTLSSDQGRLLEPILTESEAYLVRALRRLVAALGPYVVRRVEDTELFARKRKYLIVDEDSLTTDLMKFLRTMVPSGQEIKRNRDAEKNWDRYFHELGAEAKNRVQRIIDFRNIRWAHFEGYDDEEVCRCLEQILDLLNDVYRVQQKDLGMLDLMDSTALRIQQVHLMLQELSSLLSSTSLPADTTETPQSAQIERSNIASRIARPTPTHYSEGVSDDVNLAKIDLSNWFPRTEGADPSPEYQKGRADALVGLARLALNRGDFDLSVASYEAIAAFYGDGQFDAEHAVALHLRGKMHSRNRRYEQAKTDFELALKLNPTLKFEPEDAAPYHNEGNEKFFEGLYEEAVRLFTYVLELNAQGEGVYSVTRKTKRFTGGWGSSSSSFSPKRLWEIYHDRGRAHLEIGQSHLSARNTALALENFESAIADLNESDRVSERLRDVNEVARGIALLSIELLNRPNDPAALLDRARVYAGAGYFDLAIADLDKTRELGPELDSRREYWEIYVNRGDSYFDEGQYIQELEGDDELGWEVFERSIEDYTNALDYDPHNSSILYTRGIANLAIQQHEAAIGDFTAALAVNPVDGGHLEDAWGQPYEFDPVQCLFEMGRALAAMGNLEEAVRDFEAVLASERLESWPDCENEEDLDLGIEVYYHMGNAESLQGNIDLAINSFTKGMSGASLRGLWLDLWISRGEAYFRNGEYDAAVRDFDLVLGYNPGDYGTVYVRKLRGQAYTELGELDKAISDFDEYLYEFGLDGEVSRLRETAIHLQEQRYRD